jgi:ribosomal protein L29
MSQEILEKLEELRGDFAALRSQVKADLDGLRAEVKTDLDGLRAEVKTDLDGLRAEMKVGLSSLQKGQGELTIAIRESNEIVLASIEALNASLKDTREKLRSVL